MTLYAIGDIHGQIAKLDQALRWIEVDGGPEAQVIFLGDLCDRGPDSRAVIELVATGIAEGRNWRCVLGNHDLMLYEFVTEGHEAPPHLNAKGLTWLNPRLGGLTTLASYGVATEGVDLPDIKAHAATAVPQAHLDFIASRPLFIEDGACLFVHAGIRPGVPLERQDRDDLIWIREGWLDHTGALPWLVVHGHTAISTPEHHGNRVNIDTGAGFGRDLTVAAIEDHDVWTLGPKGRARLLPPA